MDDPSYIIAYDLGTTSIKTVLYELKDHLRSVGSSSEGYDLTILDNGGVEQDPSQWWSAMCKTTKEVLEKCQIDRQRIIGLSFCAQMQGLVLVNEVGDAVRPAMSYMDNRGATIMGEMMTGIKAEGLRLDILLKSLLHTGVASTSVKDPVWRYNWVKKHEPDNFKHIHKWLDVKEYLIGKATGRFVMTTDSAFATLLLDKKGERFSKPVCQSLGVDMAHLPEIVASTCKVGGITAEAAKALGLVEGTPVFGGGGDASLIGVGAGATALYDTHIYMGTSGWVSTVVPKALLDIKRHVAGIRGVSKKTYNYFAELETAGKCVEWVRDHLAADEIAYYDHLRSHEGGIERQLLDHYGYMMDVIKDVPAGSNGVMFTPWLHGNRCPFEDPSARGMFFNIGLDNGKRDMIHAVLEGVCFHLRWQLEAVGRKVATGSVIRLVGGGALAPLTCQMMADVLGKRVEVVVEPQNAGAMGAAVMVALGSGYVADINKVTEIIEVAKTYEPNNALTSIYTDLFGVFKDLYTNNKGSFAHLNK